MDITQFDNFISTLKDIDKSEKYISEGQNGFIRVSSKDDKTLNTSNIAEIGQECMDFIHASSTSYSKKAEMYQNLQNALGDYNARVYSHKNIFLKIASWFGIASKPERQLYSEVAHAAYQTEELQDRNARVKQLIATITIPPDDLSHERLFYASMLDSLSVQHKDLEGLNVPEVVAWMRKYLIEYKDQVTNNDQKEQLEHIIKELDDLKLFHMVHGIYANLDEVKSTAGPISKILIDAQYPPYMQDWLVHEVIDRIHSLQPGEEVALSGGTLTHGVVYLIRLESDKDGKNSYSFTVINTGKGAEIDKESLTEQVRKLPRDKVEALQKKIREETDPKKQVELIKEAGLRFSITDRVWTGISENNMSEELLDKILNLKSSKSMDEVNKSLSQIFEKIGAVETKGATHKAQNKGTCGLKAITSWFHQRMGDEMWRDFKYFYSEKELAKSAALKPEYQESFADLGAKIVEKRKAKKARKPTEVVKPEAQIAKNFPFTYFGLDPNNITVVQIDAIRDRFEALESKPITSFFSTHYESSPGTLARSAFTRVFNGLNYISDNWENSTKQTQELETFLAHAMCMLEAQKGNEQAIRGYRYIKLQEFITKAEQFLQYQYKDSKVPDDALELVKKLRNESQLDPFTVTDAQITELRSKIISQINGHVFFKNWTRMIPKEESGFNIQSFEALVAEAMQ